MEKIMQNTPVVAVEGIEFLCETFELLNYKIPTKQVANGPLVNIEVVDETNYIVTILAFLPDVALRPIPEQRRTGISLLNDKIYLTYGGVKKVSLVGEKFKHNEPLCRNFFIEYDSDIKAENYNSYYIKFKYHLLAGTENVDGILVRDRNDDPETDRGTVTIPVKSGY